MSSPWPGRPHVFDPDELGVTDPADFADALESARRLEASIEDLPGVTGPQFTNRVMTAIANEPTPAAVGFLTPLRRLGLIAGFGASVRQAWASIGAPGRPTFARAAALAYVLVIAIAGTSLAGAATVGFAGALGILVPATTQAPPSIMPLESTTPATELPSAESEPPEASAEPSDGPDASDDPGGGGSPEPSDDRGGALGPASTSSSGGSEDGSGSGGDGGSATWNPDGGGGSDEHGGATDTPKPSQTPRETGTPRPTQTSGSGSGSSE